jgi:hypothetical protein
VTGDDDAHAIRLLGASWAEAGMAGPPRLWFLGYWDQCQDQLLGGRAAELLTSEAADRVGREQAAGRTPGRHGD